MTKEQMHVLLIEDNPADTRYMQEALKEAAGSSIDLVCDELISKGLDRLSTNKIDAVLLDLSLPDGQGLDTFTRVHSHAPDVPVVVLTGLDDDTIAVEAVKKGAQDYLIKGQVDSRWLVRALRYAIERKNAELERERLVRELQDALGEVQTLSGLLPICAYCKKVRDDKGYWDQIESYISKHSKAEFSHGICPACLKTVDPAVYKKVYQEAGKEQSSPPELREENSESH